MHLLLEHIPAEVPLETEDGRNDGFSDLWSFVKAAVQETKQSRDMRTQDGGGGLG